MRNKDNLETELFHIGIILLAAAIATGFLYIFFLHRFLPQVPCFFSSVIGIYCPGCGGTRAVKALLQGKFLLSLWFHPVVPYTAVVWGGFLLTQGLHRLGAGRIRGWRFHYWYLYAAIILALCNFIVKNVLRLVWGICM